MNILAIGCHPDDLEIACGGTLAKYVKNGHKVVMCTVASGNMGHKEIKPDELAKIRKSEAEASAKIIGAEYVTLGVTDCTVNGSNQEIFHKLVVAIREAKPDVIITHNDDDYMQDHKETSRLAYDASFAATIPHTIPDVEATSVIPPIYYMDTLAGVNFLPTEYVDITDTVDIKLNALAQHKSQVDWMLYHDKIDFIDFVRTCSKFRGLQCGKPFAEGFRQYLGWPRIHTQRLLP